MTRPNLCFKTALRCYVEEKGSTGSKERSEKAVVKRSGKRCNSSSGGDNRYLLKAELNRFAVELVVGVRDEVELGMTPGS